MNLACSLPPIGDEDGTCASEGTWRKRDVATADTAMASTWAGDSTSSSWMRSDSRGETPGPGSARPTSEGLDLRAGLRMPGPGSSEDDYNRWVEKLWKRMDRDGGGSITRQELECEEFYEVIKVACGGAAGGGGGKSYARSTMNISEAIQFCLRKADTSGDGILQFDEFASFMKTLCNPNAKNRQNAYLIFSLFDIDGSGEIDRNEFKEMYRFFIGKNPTEAQFDEEWQRLAAAGDGEKATQKQYIKWLQTSPNPVFRGHAPPAEAPKPRKPPESRESRLAKLMNPSRCTPVDQLPKWKKSFASGLNPGHVNEVRTQGRREYFMKSQSEIHLRRFYQEHELFEGHLNALESPEPQQQHCVLWPRVLSNCGPPMTLPQRHNPGGSMLDHKTGRATMWEDYWVLPQRLRQHGKHYHRPLACSALFSEPDRNSRAATQRHGPASCRAMRGARAHPDQEVNSCRHTMLEAEPWGAPSPW